MASVDNSSSLWMPSCEGVVSVSATSLRHSATLVTRLSLASTSNVMSSFGLRLLKAATRLGRKRCAIVGGATSEARPGGWVLLGAARDLRNGVEDRSELIVYRQRFNRRRQTPALAPEELVAQPLLKLGEAPADSRLRNPQAPRRVDRASSQHESAQHFELAQRNPRAPSKSLVARYMLIHRL